MSPDANVPDDENGPSERTPGPSPAPASAAPAPTWWESINPAYAPPGAWSPGVSSSLHLTAPASTGWMPPASSFHSLAHGSSLPTAGAEPGDAMKTAAAAAATVAGDAIASAQTTADETLASAQATAAAAVGPDRGPGADAPERNAGSVDPGRPIAMAPSGAAVRPAPSAVFPGQAAQGAVRPYDAAVIRSAITDAAPDPTAPYRGGPANRSLTDARNLLPGVADPRREASIRRQAAIVVGSAVALGVLMAVFVLFGDFDAGPDESAGFAVGILITAVVQVVLLAWAVVLVLRWRTAKLPKTGWRPGTAIWITLLLSPVPLVVLRAFVETM